MDARKGRPEMKLPIWSVVALAFLGQFTATPLPGLAQATGQRSATAAPADVVGGQQGAAEQPPAGLPPLDLERLIDIALEENPELKALRHRIEAARDMVPQAGSLPDPMVGIQFSNLPIGTVAFDMTPMTGVQLVAQQALPYPGKLSLRKEVARQVANAAEMDYQERVNGLIGRVKNAYYDLYFIDRAIEITLDNKDLLQDLAATAEELYRQGRVVQQHQVRAHLAVARITDDLLDLRNRKETAQARLNTLLDRPPQAPLGAPGELTRHEFQLSRQALQDVALQDRPLLKSLGATVAQFEAAKRLAVRDLRPDFSVGVAYRIRGSSPMDAVGGRDFWSLSAMAKLPVYAKTKQRKRIDEMQENVARWQAQYETTKNEIFFGIEDAITDLRRLEDEIDLLLSGIVPEAELSLQAGRSAYMVGTADFVTVLDAQIALYKAQLQYYRALSGFEKRLADVEAIVGHRLY